MKRIGAGLFLGIAAISLACWTSAASASTIDVETYYYSVGNHSTAYAGYDANGYDLTSTAGKSDGASNNANTSGASLTVENNSAESITVTFTFDWESSISNIPSHTPPGSSIEAKAFYTDGVLSDLTSTGLSSGDDYVYSVILGAGKSFTLGTYTFANKGYATASITDLTYIYSTGAAPMSLVPVPGAIWLFGSGLAVMAGFKRRFRK